MHTCLRLTLKVVPGAVFVQVIRGTIGLVLPDLAALQKRLKSIEAQMEGTMCAAPPHAPCCFVERPGDTNPQTPRNPTLKPVRVCVSCLLGVWPTRRNVAGDGWQVLVSTRGVRRLG